MTSLYLVRHAIAAERGDDYPDDDLRPLTRTGRSRMRLAVAGFQTLTPSLDVVLTSPLLRARQTAKILVEGWKRPPDVRVCLALAPGHAPHEVAAALSSLRKAAAIALVGHEPDLGVLAAWLMGAREPLVFRKGGMARIDVDALPPNQHGRLIWLATPRMLRALSGGQPD